MYKPFWLFLFLWLLIIVLIANVKPTNTIFSFILDEGHYKYSTATGNFTFTEVKMRDTENMLRNFASYKIKMPSDTVIYRLFSKNPLCFWRLRSYYTDKRYNFPFKSWNEIRKIRGYDLKYSNNNQDF